MTYCVEVWGNACKSNLHHLYVKQKHVINLVSKNLQHTAKLLKSLHVLPFSDLIKYKLATFMYKVYPKTLPMIILMLLTQNHSTIKQVRQSNKKIVGCTRTNKKQRCIAYAGTCIWNSINLSHKMSTDLKIFKAIF